MNDNKFYFYSLTIKTDFNYDQLDKLENNIKYLKLYYNTDNKEISTLSYIFSRYEEDKTIIERLEDIHKLITDKKLIELSYHNQKYTSKYYINELKYIEDNVLYQEEEKNFKSKEDKSDIYEQLLKRIGYHQIGINCYNDDFDGKEYYTAYEFEEKFKKDKYIKIFIHYKIDFIADSYGVDEYIIQWKFLKKDKFIELKNKIEKK